MKPIAEWQREGQEEGEGKDAAHTSYDRPKNGKSFSEQRNERWQILRRTMELRKRIAFICKCEWAQLKRNEKLILIWHVAAAGSQQTGASLYTLYLEFSLYLSLSSEADVELFRVPHSALALLAALSPW